MSGCQPWKFTRLGTKSTSPLVIMGKQMLFDLPNKGKQSYLPRAKKASSILHTVLESAPEPLALVWRSGKTQIQISKTGKIHQGSELELWVCPVHWSPSYFLFFLLRNKAKPVASCCIGCNLSLGYGAPMGWTIGFWRTKECSHVTMAGWVESVQHQVRVLLILNWEDCILHL